MLAGKVSINDEICLLPAARVKEGDIVKLDDKVVSLVEEAKLYGYYKPVKTLVTRELAEDRVNIFQLVEPQLGKVFTIGRLDYYSEGLLLLTNSNKLCSELMHSNLPRVYQVQAMGWNHAMTRFVENPFSISGVDYKPWKVLGLQNDWVTIQLEEGKNREIRNVCEYFRLYIQRLIRVEFGGHSVRGQSGDLWDIKL